MGIQSGKVSGRGEAGGHLPMRHLLVICGVFILYWGATLLIELFDRLSGLGNCGYHLGPACEGGRGALAIGAPSVILGISLIGWLHGLRGWVGPVATYGGFAFLYGSGGSAVVFAVNVPNARGVGWTVLNGMAAILFLGLFVFLLRGVLSGARNGGGFTQALKELFWVLEVLPDSKKQRRRLVRERGISPEALRAGRVVPRTRREKRQWTLFTAEAALALVGGIAAGHAFIAFAS
ncbi:hypothetical protein [Streptomyces sp. NPDC088812]|uniref:hypothetical protein n=1 Tax=Streptomyces sp. NPDC088812 TaxID=3365905 RepID=UPI0037F8A119